MYIGDSCGITSMDNKEVHIPDRIIILGLYNAGKSTILKQLKVYQQGKTYSPVVSTYGTFAVENISFNNLKYICMHIGGRSGLRSFVRHGFPYTKAVVFVIDSADQKQLQTAKYELHTAAKEEGLSHAGFVILANKQDIPSAMSVEELTEKLELSEITQEWNIFGCCGCTGDGLYEAFHWISEQITTKQEEVEDNPEKTKEGNDKTEENTVKYQRNTGMEIKTERFLAKGIKDLKKYFVTAGETRNGL